MAFRLVHLCGQGNTRSPSTTHMRKMARQLSLLSPATKTFPIRLHSITTTPKEEEEDDDEGDRKKQRKADAIAALSWYLDHEKALVQQYPGKLAAITRDEGVIKVADTMYGIYDEIFKRGLPGVENPLKHVAIPVIIGKGAYSPPVLLNSPISSRFDPVELPPPHPFEYRPHLQPVFSSAFAGRFLRPFVQLGLKKSPEEMHCYPVTLLLDTGSSLSYLDSSAIKALNLTENKQGQYLMYYNGTPFYFAESTGKAAGFNILGLDFLSLGDLLVDAKEDLIEIERKQ